MSDPHSHYPDAPLEPGQRPVPPPPPPGATYGTRPDVVTAARLEAPPRVASSTPAVHADDRVVTREVTPGVVGDTVAYEPVAAFDDRVRWGPIWAGTIVAVALFALLQLALFATDAASLDINPTASDDSFTLWTALAAIVAFLVGGLVAGATARWKRFDDGLIQGVVMWSLATVGLLVVSSVAVGNLTSSLGGVLGRIADLRSALAAGGSPDQGAVDDARTVAAQACLFMGVTVVAAALGALIGAKLWPRRRTVPGDRVAA